MELADFIRLFASTEEAETPAGRARIVDMLFPVIVTEPDHTERERCLQLLGEELNLSEMDIDLFRVMFTELDEKLSALKLDP